MCHYVLRRSIEGLGNIYFDKEEYHKAREYYERAAPYVPDQEKPSFYSNLGLCHLAMGDRDTGIDHLVKCLDADEQLWEAACLLADLYWDDKNWKQALGYYQQAARYASGEDKAEAHSLSARCYEKIKDHEGAIKEYEACLAVSPDFRSARNNLGWVLQRMGRYDEAVAMLQEAARRGKDGMTPLRNLTIVLRKLKRYSEAIELLKQDTARNGGLTKFAQRQMQKIEGLLEKQAHDEAASDAAIEGEEDEDELEEAGASVGLKDDGTETSEPESDDQQVGPVMGEPLSARAREARIPRVETKIDKEDVLEGLIQDRIERGQTVFGRRLRMFEASDSRHGRYGRQFAIPGVGRIDLLTVDLDTNELVVVELKRDRPERDIVGQIREYMGWARENLAAPEQKVHGIICVWETTERLRLGVFNDPDLDVFQYELSFVKIGP